MKRSSSKCAHCGKEPPAEEKFKSCSKCVKDKVPSPTVFCSKACLEANWPTHKLWHREYKSSVAASNALKGNYGLEAQERSSREAALLVAGVPIAGSADPVEAADLGHFSNIATSAQLEQAAAVIRETTANYSQLLGRGTQLMQSGDLKGAEKVLKKAIKLWPNCPNAHNNNQHWAPST